MRDRRVPKSVLCILAALAAIGQDDDRAVLLAMAAVEATRSVDGTVLPEALDALRATIGSHRIDARLDAGGGERVPTLDEVLDAFGQRIAFNLEIKCEPDRGPYPGLEEALGASGVTPTM